MEGNPDFLYMGTVTANGFVELISSDAELFGPVGNIRCHFRIDLFRIMWTLCVFFVNRVRLVRFWCIVMLEHLIFPFLSCIVWMTKESMAMPCWTKTSETHASNSIAPNVDSANRSFGRRRGRSLRLRTGTMDGEATLCH